GAHLLGAHLLGERPGSAPDLPVKWLPATGERSEDADKPTPSGPPGQVLDRVIQPRGGAGRTGSSSRRFSVREFRGGSGDAGQSFGHSREPTCGVPSPRA